jgi:glycosyltransferase involved in cell wall biosynthesis
MITAQDLYPEAVAAHGLLSPSSRSYRLLRAVLDRAYRGASVVISLGPYMTRRLLAKGVRADRIEEISNYGVGDVWPWTGPNPLRREWGLEDKFVVLYSGNMGLGHEFETFLEGAAEAKRELPELTVVFVGGGPRRKEIENWVEGHGAQDWILFRPYQPQDRLRETLGIADLSLVTMRDGWEGLVVPSKALGIFAMGSPTLYVGPESDISALVEGLGAGVNVSGGDVAGVRDAILRAARDEDWRHKVGQNAVEGYRERLSLETALDRYEEVLSRLLG